MAPVTTGGSWPELDFSEDPRLLVGYRSAQTKRLSGKRVSLHEDVFPELEAICHPALDHLRGARAREYEPFAELERGEEYFAVDVSDLPLHPPMIETASAETTGGGPADEENLQTSSCLFEL